MSIRLLKLALPLLVSAALVTPLPGICADENAPVELTPRQIGEQVDVLQMVTNLELDQNQIKALASQAAALKQKREEALKREDAILQGMEKPLKELRDRLAAGETVPETISSVTEAKLKEMQSLRLQMHRELLSAASAVNQTMTEKQTHNLTRNPETKQRAAELVSIIRSTSETEWSSKLKELTAQLLGIRKIDKEIEWAGAEKEKLTDLKGGEREAARKELEKQKATETAQIQTEISDELTRIRLADRKLIPIAVNNLCSDLRSRTEVRIELLNILCGILSNPSAEMALNERLARFKLDQGS